MRHELSIELQRRPGSLLRTLVQIERRGFAVERLRGDRLIDADHASAETGTLELTLRGETPVDVLARQLRRLLDVHSVASRPATDTQDHSDA